MESGAVERVGDCVIFSLPAITPSRSLIPSRCTDKSPIVSATQPSYRTGTLNWRVDTSYPSANRDDDDLRRWSSEEMPNSPPPACLWDPRNTPTLSLGNWIYLRPNATPSQPVRTDRDSWTPFGVGSVSRIPRTFVCYTRGPNGPIVRCRLCFVGMFKGLT